MKSFKSLLLLSVILLIQCISFISTADELKERSPARGRQFGGYGYNPNPPGYRPPPPPPQYPNYPQQPLYVGEQGPVNKYKVQSPDEQNIADNCPVRQYRCDPNAKYRTMDGSCNNLRKPWWGAVNTPHVRLMQPTYDDGRSEYRRSVVDKSELPSPRLLSTTFLPDRDVPDVHTRMFLQFAQLVAHDITLNGQKQGPKCCSESGDRVLSQSGICKPIVIPDKDPFYAKFGRKCLEYKQSRTVNCSFGYPLPIVGSTHFIDASLVYGSTNRKSQALRTGSFGQLRTQPTSRKGHLPTSTNSTGDCPYRPKFCYDAGDARINQHLDLAVTQTILLRFHNYLAETLNYLNPSWQGNDELLYQEARRILIGIFQHITYSDWLPLLIGRKYAKAAGLAPEKQGYFTGYDENVNPSTLADFAGGAYRSLHSLIPGIITLVGKDRRSAQTLPFTASVEKPGNYLQDGDNFDSTIRGLVSQPQQYQDKFMSTQLTEQFLDDVVPNQGRSGFGDDVSARDIQRGRDFGLKPYVDYRELCEQPGVRDFSDLSGSIDPQEVQKLSQVYKNVKDIDYYIGALLERTIPGTLTTPSNRCVLGEAFYRYKYGDRYFYESASNPGIFNPIQLKKIKSITLSHLLCIGSDNLQEIQVNAFRQPSQSNPVVPCASLTNIDWSCFRQ